MSAFPPIRSPSSKMNTYHETIPASAILRRARDLIAGPQAWIKGAFAKIRPYYPTDVDSRSPAASCFCALGALQRAIDEARKLGQFPPPLSRAEEALRKFNGDRAVPTWNDANDTTHADVLEAFDHAIRYEEARDAV